MRNAAALVRAGAGAVKLEGGRKRLDAVAAILDAEIPVMGHLGLTPQSIHALGGFRVQGKQLDAARAIVDDAVALAEAGCFAIVLECVPDGVARMVTDADRRPDDRDRRRPPLRRPGARVPRPARARGPDACRSSCAATPTCGRSATTARRAASSTTCATGTFPSSDETYHMTDQMGEAFDLVRREAGAR